MTIYGVVFDLGHTLMHLEGTWEEAFEHGLLDMAAFLEGWTRGLDGRGVAQAFLERRRETFPVARQSMREVTAEESLLWTFARLGLPDPEPQLVRGALDAFFAYEGTRWSADPQALPVLRELAEKGLRLGMYSNATHDPLIQQLVDRFGFRAWLEPALSSAGTGLRKPDPAALGLILEAWKLPAGSVAMVGDTLEEDILGAIRAGMKSVWLRSRTDARQDGGTPPDAQGQPQITADVTVERLEEVPLRLERL